MTRPTHMRPDGSLCFPEGEPDAAPLPEGYWDERDLATLTADLLARIDQEAGAFRSRFITTVPGQEMTYLDKEAQARAFVQGAPIDDCPIIQAEAAVRGISETDMAQLVIAQADGWRQLGAAIEAARIGGKNAVSAAATETDKRAAAQIDWEALVP